MYRSTRKHIQEGNITSYILFRTKLKLFLQDGQTKTFDTPRAATEGLQVFGVIQGGGLGDSSAGGRLVFFLK